MNKDGLRPCSKICMKLKEGCPHQDCRMWIDYEEEYNCTLVSIYENGCMTLRQVGERLGISFARVKQIEEKALLKMKRRTNYW